MFKDLKFTTATAAASAALAQEDEAADHQADIALESWVALPADVLAEQQVESELDHLESLAAVIEKHGVSPALMAHANEGGDLAAILGMKSEVLETANAEIVLSAIRSTITRLESGEEGAVEGIGDVLAAQWMMWVEQAITFFKAILNLFDPRITTVWRQRLQRYAQSVRTKSWDAGKADDGYMKAQSAAALKAEVDAALKLDQTMRDIWGTKLPTTKDEYAKWADKVAKAIAPYSEIYGISVEKKGWFIKRPKVVVSDPATKYARTKAAPAKLGYSDSSMESLAKAGEDLVRMCEKVGKLSTTYARTYETAQADLKNKKLGFFAGIKETHYLKASQKLSIRLGMALYRQGLSTRTMPALLSTMGQLRRCYTNRDTK